MLTMLTLLTLLSSEQSGHIDLDFSVLGGMSGMLSGPAKLSASCILFAKVEDERLVGAALILNFEDERRPCQSHSLAGNNASKIFS